MRCDGVPACFGDAVVLEGVVVNKGGNGVAASEKCWWVRLCGGIGFFSADVNFGFLFEFGSFMVGFGMVI